MRGVGSEQGGDQLQCESRSAIDLKVQALFELVECAQC